MRRVVIRRAVFALAVAVLSVAIVFSRTHRLAADPPAWTQTDYITDEGWWADGARGKVFFDDYFADDVGIAYLMAPGYTWSLQGLYRVFGVGLAQTRLLACSASLATLGLLVLLGFRFADAKAGILAGALLGISPFCWAYSRMAFIEPTQGLFTLLGLSAWLALGDGFWGGLLSGAAMGVAFAMKPNTITIAVPAIVLAAVASRLYQRKGGGDQRSGTVAGIHSGGLLGAALGFFAVVASVLGVVALPHWSQYLRIAVRESGVAQRPLRNYVTAPGAAFLSVADGESRVFVWHLARWSPAIFVGVWGYATSRIARWSTGTAQVRRSSPFEIAVTVWTATQLLVILSKTYQPERRFVLVLPGLAILAAVYVADILTAPRPHPESGRIGHSIGRSIALWVAATFPLLVLVKPAATNLVMRVAHGLSVGAQGGLGYPAAGTLVMLAWLMVAAAPAFSRSATARVSRAVLSRWPAVVVALLAGYEMVAVGVQLSTGTTSFVEQQTNLRRYVVADEVVLGDVAASLFLPYPVRTVRREDKPPALNPDVGERLHPRYIVEQTWRDFRPVTPRFQDLIESGRYALVHEFSVGPTRSGAPRHRFELFEDLTRR